MVKLRGGETVRGWIEYFDDGMLRLTREGKPNLLSTSTRSRRLPRRVSVERRAMSRESRILRAA